MSNLRKSLRQSQADDERASDASTAICTIGTQDVHYRHADGGGVTGVNLNLRRGEVVGITGPSGSGKTTFIDLLTGLLQPEGGQVLVNGQPVDASQFRQFRDRIAYIPQDSYLLNDTIRHNLAWGRADVSEAAMWRALEASGASQFVGQSQNGLDTPVAERGSRLSGGERQRIAIARALLRCPDVIILDEATNAIDVVSERLIIADLVAMPSKPMIVLVTHRPETLRLCERLITFEAGQIAPEIHLRKIGGKATLAPDRIGVPPFELNR
nr:ABC transporter ATP-binding protein [Novosphingobium hassiacum]